MEVRGRRRHGRHHPRAVPEHLRPGGARPALHGGHRRLVRVEGNEGRLHRRREELRLRFLAEHAPIAIKASGASAVIARSFARIFYRNAFNMGLPIFEAPDAVDEIAAGDRLAVDMERGFLRNETKGKEYRFTPIPLFMRELVAAGGLLRYISMRKKGA